MLHKDFLDRINVGFAWGLIESFATQPREQPVRSLSKRAARVTRLSGPVERSGRLHTSRTAALVSSLKQSVS